MDPIDSIPEPSASDEIAAVYADIKRTLHAPTTNLIWRHLATIPGALERVWHGIKPLYRDGTLASAASVLNAALAPDPVPQWTSRELRSAGVADAALGTILAILENYARTNPANLIALNAMMARIEGRAEPARFETAPVPRREPDPLPPLPALIAEADMREAVRHDARRLDQIGLAPSDGPVVAGVPRHLAHWPGLLRLAVERLEPIDESVGRAITDVQQRARALGEQLANRLPAFEEPGRHVSLMAALERFSSDALIANYIVKVHLLQAALGAAAGKLPDTSPGAR